MEFADPLRDASFAKRVNHLLASVQIDGRKEYVHVPNSGRMAEFLAAGKSIKLRERESRTRKARYDICLVDFNGFWVSIDARPPGILLADSIGKDAFPDFTGYSLIKREVTYRSSRFDFLSPNKSTDPSFAEALNTGYSLGVKAFAFNCEVNEKEITLKDRSPVIL